MKYLLLGIVVCLLLTSTLAFSAVNIPKLISLQGKLTDANSNPLSGDYDFSFDIYGSPSGTDKITPTAITQTSTLDNGVFNILIPTTVSFDKMYWLDIKVKPHTGSTYEGMTQRVQITSSGYAYTAAGADDFNVRGNINGLQQTIRLNNDDRWAYIMDETNTVYKGLAAKELWTDSGNIYGPAGTTLKYNDVAVGGGSSGVTQIVAGSGISVSPTGGTGVVTVTNTAGTSGVSGSGTTNNITKWTGSGTVGNSIIYDDGSGNIGIGTNSPGARIGIQNINGYELRFKGMDRTNIRSDTNISFFISHDIIAISNDGLIVIKNQTFGGVSRNTWPETFMYRNGYLTCGNTGSNTSLFGPINKIECTSTKVTVNCTQGNLTWAGCESTNGAGKLIKSKPAGAIDTTSWNKIPSVSNQWTCEFDAATEKKIYVQCARQDIPGKLNPVGNFIIGDNWATDFNYIYTPYKRIITASNAQLALGASNVNEAMFTVNGWTYGDSLGGSDPLYPDRVYAFLLQPGISHPITWTGDY